MVDAFECEILDAFNAEDRVLLHTLLNRLGGFVAMGN